MPGMNTPSRYFHSLRMGLDYQTRCPLCKDLLKINDRDLASDWGYGGHEYGGDHRIAFYVSQKDDDAIVINPNTDEVELVVAKRWSPEVVVEAVNGEFEPSFKPSAQPIYNGKFMHALTIDCKSCCQYSYTLQVHFDLSEEILIGVYLNSESLSIEESGMVHEIKNSYAAQLTYYSYFDKEGDSKRDCLPLIPLDLDNPKETVSRIRKLLIFS